MQILKTTYTASEIKAILAKHKPSRTPLPGRKPASVLMPFYPEPGGLSLVFMMRPDYPGVHGGQISFPGGGKDEADNDDLETALRETEEEIGVNRDHVETWGVLSTSRTLSSNFWITPFVGGIPYPYDFKVDRREVERLIIVPFSHLLAPGTYSYGPIDWKGFTFESDLYRFEDDLIWGLTARILKSFISLIQTGRE